MKHFYSFIVFFSFLFLTSIIPVSGQQNNSIDIKSPLYQKLFQELIDKHHFKSTELQSLFHGVSINQKVLDLMNKQWGKPLPWYKYKPRFITNTGIKEGKRYLKKYRPIFDRIEREFGVNQEAVVAIWSIETNFGRNTGSFNLFRSLNTLFAGYPRRSDFFRKELIEFLLLCRANKINPKTVEGSYAGAFGQAQFMPSSYNKYAVDYDGDGKVDLIDSRPDVFASIANYLHSHGWHLDRPTFIDIGNKLHSARLVAVSEQSWQGRIDWESVVKVQKVSIPRPLSGGQLTIAALDLNPQKGGGTRYVAGYPNFQAIQHYNHSQKYAMVVSTLTKEFVKK